MPKKPAPLTWDAILQTIELAGRRGLTNRQIASHLGAPVHRVTMLTLIMWEAGAIDRGQGEEGYTLTLVYFAKKARPWMREVIL